MSKQDYPLCSVHSTKTYQYLCPSGSCNYLPLCIECKKNHNSQHHNNLIRYSIAIDKAKKNLSSQINKLQEHIKPFQLRKQLQIHVNQQIQKLQKQKTKLIQIIKQKIDNQIKKLREHNSLIQKDNQINYYKELISKKQSLNNNLNELQKKPNVLRQVLMSQIQSFLHKIGQKNDLMTKARTDSNLAFLYENVQHQFLLSDLKLKTKILNPKLLKKVYNQSPLYFLIDSKYETGKYLHFFIPKLKQLRIYDVQIQKWYKYFYRGENERFDFKQNYSTICDQKHNLFYYIGGKNSKQILCFNKKQQKWSIYTMRYIRQSPMTTIIYKNNQSSNSLNANYILIAGGISSDNKILQTWEILDPQKKSIICQGIMNFATAGGKLVTFQNNNVFKIGGYAKKNSSSYGICPIIQKCDFSGLTNKIKDEQLKVKQFNFKYIQIQDICKNSLQFEQRKHQLYYGHQGAIQINANQIFVFGGRLTNQKGTNQTYILNIEKFEMFNYKKQKVNSYRYYARWINEKPMISSQDFQHLSHCIWKNKIYSLQNISNLRPDCFHKKLVQFDMKSWYQTENIVQDDMIL